MKDVIEKSLGAHIVHAARLHRIRIAQLLKDLGLFPGQERVLQLLETHGRLNMGELAGSLRVRPPTISKTVGRLSTQGLVTRLGSESDARVVDVMLTDLGRERAGMILGIWQQIEDEMADGLDSKDRRRMRKGLKRVSKNLSGSVGTDVVELDLDEDDDA